MLRRWWAVHREDTTPVSEVDLRPGGRYRMSFQTDDGERHQVGGVYREVVKVRGSMKLLAVTVLLGLSASLRAAEPKKLLVISATAGARHASIPNGEKMLREVAAKSNGQFTLVMLSDAPDYPFSRLPGGGRGTIAPPPTPKGPFTPAQMQHAGQFLVHVEHAEKHAHRVPLAPALLERDAHPRLGGDLVAGAGEAAARGIAQAAEARSNIEHGADQRVQRRRIALHGTFKLEPFALRQDGDTVLANRGFAVPRSIQSRRSY